MIYTIDGVEYKVNEENLIHEFDSIKMLPGEIRSIRKIYQVSQRKYVTDYKIYSKDENDNWKEGVGFECIINRSEYIGCLKKLMECIDDPYRIINKLYDKKLDAFVKENLRSELDKPTKQISRKKEPSEVIKLSDYMVR